MREYAAENRIKDCKSTILQEVTEATTVVVSIKCQEGERII